MIGTRITPRHSVLLSSKRNCFSRIAINQQQQLKLVQPRSRCFVCASGGTRTENYESVGERRRKNRSDNKDGHDGNHIHGDMSSVIQVSPSLVSLSKRSVDDSCLIQPRQQQEHWKGNLVGLRYFSTNAENGGEKKNKDEPGRKDISLGSDTSNNINTQKTIAAAGATSITTEQYLSSLGYEDDKLQSGMKDALKAAFGKNITVAHLKSLGADGLSALSKSVENELQMNSHNNDAPMYTVHVKVPHHKFEFDLKVREGDNFMDVVTQTAEGREMLGEYLECSCGGNMSCATCHIILDPVSFDKLKLGGNPCEAECDMLDLAYEPTDTSRLGCQVVMTKELGGMVVTIPAGVNNLW